MTTVASNLDTSTDVYRWRGALMRTKARAANTGGAIGLIDRRCRWIASEIVGR